MALNVATVEAQVSRYTGTIKGNIVVTGNTLGLSKATNSNGPGTCASIGTFITTDALSFDSVPTAIGVAWPAGTTSDWTKNRSTGEALSFPTSSTIVRAELVWAGSYNFGGQNVSAALDTPVTLYQGTAMTSVAPSTTTAVTLAVPESSFSANYYIRSADVTAFVALHGSGVYEVGGVPATEATTINSLQAAGWALVVVYADPDAPTRSISLSIGGDYVDENHTADTSFSGFCTSASGSASATLLVATMLGDADQVGDALEIATTAVDQFVAVSGANNSSSNFFGSQINDSDGALDTSGSFGTSNHDAAHATPTQGARQGWDLTTVHATSSSGQVGNGQTTAVVRALTTGDQYLPVLTAFVVDENGPNIDHTHAIAITPANPRPGDVVTGSVTILNGGTVAATNASFALTLPSGFVVSSFMVDGAVQATDSAMLASGVPIGTLAPGGSVTITLVLDTTGTASTSVVLAPSIAYDFVACPSAPAIPGSIALATTTIDFASNSGDGGTGAGDGDNGTMSSSPGGCGCQSNSSTGGVLALLVLASIVRRRRGVR